MGVDSPAERHIPGCHLRVTPGRQAASIGPATTRAQPTPAALSAGPPERWWIGIVEPLAAERDELVAAAVAAVPAQEAMRQDAVSEEGVEPVIHELRQVGADGVFGLLEESRDVLLHQTVRRGLLGAVALASEQGCHPAPAGAAAPWLARKAAEGVSPHGLKPCAAPQSPGKQPGDVCPLVRGLQRVPVCGSDRQLRGGEIGTSDVSSGSYAGLRSSTWGGRFRSST